MAAMAMLRIYTREDETWQGTSLHSALVQRARQSAIAGATVLRGVEGYGADRRVHTARLIDISPQLPMIVEFVDEEQKLRDFLAAVEEMLGSGLATLQPVEVVRHVAGD